MQESTQEVTDGASSPVAGFTNRLEFLLQDAVAALDMEHAIIGRIADGTFIVHAVAGNVEIATSDWSDYEVALATLSIRLGSILDVPDAAADARYAPLGMTAASGLRSFIAMPLEVEKEGWAIALTSREQRPRLLSADQYMYLRLIESMLRRSVERAPTSADFSRLAFFDALTDLPNRTTTLRRLAEAVANARRTKERVGVLYVDIDGFKQINDTHGHAIGDHVLTSLAHRMRDTLRLGEFIGRIGGDEFAVLFPSVRNESELIEVATRLAEVAALPIEYRDVRTQVGASIGIAVFPDDAKSSEELLTHADAAMYTAKAQRDSRYCYYNRELGAALQRRHDLSSKLQSADSNREFLLCYQPIIDAKNQTVTGVEALLRWMHPSMGLLPPRAFMDLARENHLMALIDAWVVDAVLEQSRRWKANGFEPALYINVSSPNRAIIDAIREARREHGMDSSHIFVELDEAQASADFEATLDFMEAAKSNGIGVGLDRFGAGGMPILTVGQLPLSFVKLDRRLLEGVRFGGENGAALEAAIGVARQFRWKIIAEGIENDEQLRWLEAQRISAVQGYAIAHPMTAVDLLTWSAARSSGEALKA